MDTQFSQPCHDKVGSSCVKIGIISSTKRKDIQQFVKELTHSDKFDLCQQILELNGLDKFKPPSEWNAVILLHSANLGRISLTDVENAWYDQLLKDLYNDKGKDAICIIAHDVKGWQDDLREEQLLNIQCDQKSAFNHSKHVIICNKLDTMHEKDSEILNDFLGKVYHAVTGKQLKTEDAMKPVVDQSEVSPILAQKSQTESPLKDYGGHGNINPMSGPIGDQTSSTMAKAKLASFTNWSISAYKSTRQIVQEKLGMATRTVDVQLEGQIEVLRDTQQKYATILKLTKALTNQFYHVVQTQRSLGDAFGELSRNSLELQNDFSYNAETQKSLYVNGETLLSALNFFTSSVSTLCNKTMEDMLLTVKAYETARIEYDAYRADMEHLSLASKDAQAHAGLHEASQKYETVKEKYNKSKQDVSVKLKFLDENKVKMMHKLLLLFNNAVAAYFSGNEQALQATLKQFNIEPKSLSEMQPSFFEKTVEQIGNIMYPS